QALRREGDPVPRRGGQGGREALGHRRALREHEHDEPGPRHGRGGGGGEAGRGGEGPRAGAVFRRERGRPDHGVVDGLAPHATVPGVEASAASVKGAAFADGGTLVTVYGVDLTGDVPERVYGARLEVDDPLVFLARPDSIALARPFAAARGLEPGDRLELATP